MVRLYQIDSPINREQRNNINATFSDILIRFTNLKYQISILSGGEDLDEILQRIEDTITNANNTTAETQQILNQFTNALNELQTALNSSYTATDAANQAIQDLQTEINRVQSLIDNLGNAESYDNSKIYQKNNVVEYNGSSFMAIQETTGNLPPMLPNKRNDYWQLLAQRGVDGTGSVSAVNGISPDVNGNVILNNDNVNATSKNEFDNHAQNNKIHKINVTSFGAVFDGATDDTVAIQNAVDYLESLGGGDLYLPQGTAMVSQTIRISKPITIIGSGQGSDVVNTNGELLGVTGIRWSGDIGGTIFEVKSDIPNNYLFGGGFKNLTINGSSNADIGILCSSVGYMNFEQLKIREVRAHGMKIDANNGVLSQFNRISDYHFVFGANDAVRNANGLYLGDSVGGLVTQTHVLSITGLVQDGCLIKIGFSDNNIFEKIGGAVIGNGYNLYLANDVRVAANANLIKYMGGRVYAESNTFGNRIMHYISEGGSIFVEEGAQLHYEVEDYQTSEIYKTHTYNMTDELSVTAGELLQIRNTTVGENALYWGCINMPMSVNSKIGYTSPYIYSWDKGNIESVTVHFSTDTQNTNANFVSRISLTTSGKLSSNTTPKFDAVMNINVTDSPFINQSLNVPVNVEYSRNDNLYLTFERVGVSADDNVTGNVQILGFTVNYVSVGADSPGSGTYQVGKPYIDSSRL